MGTVDITGDVVVPDGVGVWITLGASGSSEDWTVTNSGTIDSGLDSLLIDGIPATLTATGAFIIDNSGVMNSTTGHAINFDLAVASPGSITITNQATGLMQVSTGDAIVVARDSAATITNRGTIVGGILTTGGADMFNLFTGSSISGLLNGGLGNDTINLDGTGQGTLNSFTNVEVVNLINGDWTLGSENVASVNFQTGAQTLGLAEAVLADGMFNGTIGNFSPGDTIDLEGIGLVTSATLGAGNVLTLASAAGPVTLQLDPLQNFSGQIFQLASDGTGGTNVTVANMGTIDITGTVTAISSPGVQITVNAGDPGASWTITNSGTITSNVDGVLVNADPATLAATGTFIIDNSGTIESTESGVAINFDLLLTSPGSVTITNQTTGLIEAAAGAIVIEGDSDDTINNLGTINGGISTGDGADTLNLFTGATISGLVDSGLGTDIVNLDGTGQGSFTSFTNVETVNLLGGDWTLGSDGVAAVNFQGGLQTLSLAASVLADAQFDGTISNFFIGDVIDLEGIGLATSATLGANNLLTVAGGTTGPITLQLDPLQNFSNQPFFVISDGAGGTNVVAGSLFALEGLGDITVIGDGAFGVSIDVTSPFTSFTFTYSATLTATDHGVSVTSPSDVTAIGTFVIDNSGTIRSTDTGDGIHFDIGVASPGGISIINQQTGTIEGATGNAIFVGRDSAAAITNKGTIIGGILTTGGADTFNLFTGSSISGLLDSGLGTDTVNLDGNDQGTLNNFANVEVINLNSGDWTLGSEGVTSVNFQDGLQTLSLGATVLTGGFDGTINNFAVGDIIDFTGIGLATSATLGTANVLTIAGGSTGDITLQLDPTQDFTGLEFQLASDGAGGTNITLAPAGLGGVVLSGTNGDDEIISGTGNDLILSGDGDDQVFGAGGDDTIQAGNGTSTLDGGSGNDVLIAGDGDSNDLLGGGGGDSLTVGDGDGNLLAGGQGNDSLTVGDGNDNTLDGGAGADVFHVGAGDNNILTGGGGGDTFFFALDSGNSEITDFHHNDAIQIAGVFDDFQTLLNASEQVGADTVITLDADSTIILEGVSLNKLHESEFLLA